MNTFLGLQTDPVPLGSAEGSAGQAWFHLRWGLGLVHYRPLRCCGIGGKGKAYPVSLFFNHVVESSNNIIHLQHPEPANFSGVAQFEASAVMCPLQVASATLRWVSCPDSHHPEAGPTGSPLVL